MHRIIEDGRSAGFRPDRRRCLAPPVRPHDACGALPVMLARPARTLAGGRAPVPPEAWARRTNLDLEGGEKQRIWAEVRCGTGRSVLGGRRISGARLMWWPIFFFLFYMGDSFILMWDGTYLIMTCGGFLRMGPATDSLYQLSIFFIANYAVYMYAFLTNFKEQLWYSGGQDIYLRNRISAFIGYMWVVRCLHLLLYVYTMYAYFLYQDMYLIDRHSKRCVLLACTEDGSLFSISISSYNHKETKAVFSWRES